MIKRTLYFGNPSYLSCKLKQLVIEVKNNNSNTVKSVPIEDIGIVLLDHSQITITHQVIKSLHENKAAIVSCNDQHLPASMMLPLEGHTTQSERYRYQIQASVPLKKNLWQQTVEAKIQNQIRVLKILDKPSKRLEVIIKRIQSGDPENIEGQAAAYYWPNYIDGFTRDRFGEPPNNLLNYGYAVLRAMVARSLVASGLIPTLGIHHKNKYNAYCLADDIMEPYRPFVDLIVFQMYEEIGIDTFLTKEAKRQLLSIATVDAMFPSKRSPLMVGMAMTTASLAQCFEGNKRKISYPSII